MTSHYYQSDEEIIRRLQVILHEQGDTAHDRARRENVVREVRNLTAELAERIYREPDTWGIEEIPIEYRGDAAADVLLQMLTRVSTMGSPRNIREWYVNAVETRFKELWSSADRETRARESEEMTARSREEVAGTAQGATVVFEENAELWQRFEGEFPRDAFALRLRYQLNRTPDEMAVMLDAPSERAITIRLNRAKERFRMYCEQAGLSQRETAGILAQFSEERSS